MAEKKTTKKTAAKETTAKKSTTKKTTEKMKKAIQYIVLMLVFMFII